MMNTTLQSCVSTLRCVKLLWKKLKYPNPSRPAEELLHPAATVMFCNYCGVSQKWDLVLDLWTQLILKWFVFFFVFLKQCFYKLLSLKSKNALLRKAVAHCFVCTLYQIHHSVWQENLLWHHETVDTDEYGRSWWKVPQKRVHLHISIMPVSMVFFVLYQLNKYLCVL